MRRVSASASSRSFRTGSGFSSKFSISLGAIVDTCPLGDGLGLGEGVSVGVGVGLGVSSGLGEGVGLRSFFRIVPGVGVRVGVGVSVGVGLAFFFAFLFGVAEGEGEGELFLFVRWRDGVGLGLTKICRIFSPNDGAAAEGDGAGSRMATSTLAASQLVRRGRAIPGVWILPNDRWPQSPAGPPCSSGFRSRGFRAGNSRSANAPGNHAKRAREAVFPPPEYHGTGRRSGYFHLRG